MLDVLYHIFTGTDDRFREQHNEKLLKTYYSSLSDTIRSLGSDPDELYTYENFQDQMHKFGQFALILGPMIMVLLVAGAKHIRDLDEWVEQLDQGEDADLLETFDEETQQKYSYLINGMVTDLVNYGYIGNDQPFPFCL